MATQPTQLPVPSESPRDLKFNAGKIDEFVNSDSAVLIDRFSKQKMTLSGILSKAQSVISDANSQLEYAISQTGYVTTDSFEDGATLTARNEALRYRSNGEYYRWDGSFPKSVAAGSTPASSGGVGPGKWVSVGDGALRSSLNSTAEMQGDFLVRVKQPANGSASITQHDKNNDQWSVTDFGAKLDGVTDDTAAFQAAAASGRPVFVPTKGTIKLTTYVAGDFWAYSQPVYASDKYGHASVAVINKDKFAAKFTDIKAKMAKGQVVNICCYGDSTTDGLGSSGWVGRGTTPPESYDPPNAYPLRLRQLLLEMTNNQVISVHNCGYSGQQVLNGWAYDNYDSAVRSPFGKPDICIIMFGLNDVYQGENFTTEKFRAAYLKLIRLIVKDGTLPILMTPDRSGQTANRYDVLINQAVNTIRDICQEIGTPLIDQWSEQEKWLYGGTEDDLARLGSRTTDMLHYEDYGYAFVASVVARDLCDFVLKTNRDYTVIPAYNCKILNRKGSGYDNGLNFYRNINSRINVTSLWYPGDAQAGDVIVEAWLWNGLNNSVLRYQSVGNDGWNNTIAAANRPRIAVYPRSYGPNLNPGGEVEVAGAGKADIAGYIAGECSQVLAGGGTLPYGLIKVTYKLYGNPPPANAYFGYFSVSKGGPAARTINSYLAVSSANHRIFMNQFDPNNDNREGFGVNGATTTLFFKGKMPNNTGVVLCASRTYSGNGNNQAPRYTGIVISRANNNLTIAKANWNDSADFGVALTGEVSSSGATVTNDDYWMVVSLTKGATNFVVSVNHSQASLTKTEAVASWDVSTGGFHGACLLRGGFTSATGALAVHEISRQ